MVGGNTPVFKQACYLPLTLKSPASSLVGEERGPATSITLTGRVESSLLPQLTEHLRSPHITTEKQILT